MKKLVLFFAMFLFSAATFAQSGSAGESLTWTLSDGTLTISGAGMMPDYDVSNSINSPWSDYEKSITAVIIGNGITTIGNCAFFNCGSLTSVTLGNSVTTIGESAFSWCRSLTSIALPNSVTAIGKSAFRECRSLTSITLGNSVTTIGADAFLECRSLTSVKLGNSVTTIGTGAFSYCISLMSIVLPNPVTTIGENAFMCCYALTSVKLGNSVTTIGAGAFSGCSSLTSVTLGNSVTTIGAGAFSGCSSLTSIVLPNPVTTIGETAFMDCYALTSVTLGNSVTAIGNRAFRECRSLTSIVLPNSVTTIGSWAFDGCSSLTSIALPNSVTAVGNCAFDGCISLTSVTLGNSVTAIGSWAFSYCISLTSIVLPNSVTTIGSRAFFNCRSLTSIILPNSVTAIEENAFRDCIALGDVYVSWPTPLSISDAVFYGTPVASCTLHVPAGTETLYKAAPVWQDFLIPGGAPSLSVPPAGDGQNYLILSLGIPSDDPFNGTFLVIFPPGMSLDVINTALVGSLTNQYDLIITPQSAGTWLVEIRPKSILRTRSATSYQEIVRLAYTVDESVTYGSYEIKVSDLEIVVGGQTVIREDEIAVAVTVGPTANAPVAEVATEVWYYAGRLSVRTPAREQIAVYSLNGALVFHAEKEAGLTTFNLNGLLAGVYIVRGSSGWTRKIMLL